jgi:hypothetical protein
MQPPRKVEQDMRLISELTDVRFQLWMLEDVPIARISLVCGLGFAGLGEVGGELKRGGEPGR